MNSDPLRTLEQPTPVATSPQVTKRSFVVTSSDGATPLAARIPVDLRVGVAIAELAAYAGHPDQPLLATRYALVATTANGDHLLVPDDATFGDLPEGTVLRVAAQPRAA